ncbi:ThiF family adenylyltransferase [Motiliproteus sediminis]|uniref:ThiF family adenylyltransferase n=1 Tax=Motiliproteus sediminis TaxID=1468178 RepID=UPI001AEFA37C|nr:ThiF family adenylyltransferase [Motiliproteus sediminis]
MAIEFDYTRAFSRNIGWFTEVEQRVLRTKRVAIAGMGGVGGSHTLTLTRLGIGAFNLSDFDSFEVENFNRQAGARMSTVGESKLASIAAMATDINPELDLKLFEQGVDADNIDAFLDGVDLYVDGLDFFALPIRRRMFAACRAKGIPAVTVAPLGMGAALLNFTPDGMSFDDYFQFNGASEDEQYLRFFLGLAPAGLHAQYLVDPTKIDLEARKGPSTAIGCELCAGVAGAQAVKLLLKRGKVVAAPRGLHFDAYRNRLAHSWLPWGNAGPLRRLIIRLAAKKMLGRRRSDIEASATPYEPATLAERVIDLARWAPSGDNTQPWRFQLQNPTEFTLLCSDTRDWVVYDLDGRASQLAVGALVESIHLAASAYGAVATVTFRSDQPEESPVADVVLVPTDDVVKDPLADFLPVRTVQRRAMRRRPLTADEKHALQGVLLPGYRLRFFTGDERTSAAKLMYMNAKVRLTMPEAYQVHKHIIEWGTQFSDDRIPEQAVGVDPVTAKLMKWAMSSWERVRFFNRYMLGTIPPRVQLDLIPGLMCAAHYAIVADNEPETLEDYLNAGRVTQRVWLKATQLGLSVQPEMTPLIFARYLRQGVEFTADSQVASLARSCSQRYQALLGADAARAVFMGRIGDGPAPYSRSLRKREALFVEETE